MYILSMDNGCLAYVLRRFFSLIFSQWIILLYGQHHVVKAFSSAEYDSSQITMRGCPSLINLSLNESLTSNVNTACSLHCMRSSLEEVTRSSTRKLVHPCRFLHHGWADNLLAYLQYVWGIHCYACFQAARHNKTQSSRTHRENMLYYWHSSTVTASNFRFGNRMIQLQKCTHCSFLFLSTQNWSLLFALNQIGPSLSDH